MNWKMIKNYKIYSFAFFGQDVYNMKFRTVTIKCSNSTKCASQNTADGVFYGMAELAEWRN